MIISRRGAAPDSSRDDSSTRRGLKLQSEQTTSVIPGPPPGRPRVSIGLDDAALESLLVHHRRRVDRFFQPLVKWCYPDLLQADNDEYAKLVELTTKMTTVGHACTLTAGYEFDDRREMISHLYGGCCFLADSFIDDFDDRVTREYLDRLERFLNDGWFEVRNDRERLYYVLASRMFRERDILKPILRQAIIWLFIAQKKDSLLRLSSNALWDKPRRERLSMLREYARNRGGHTSTLLARLLVPEMPIPCYQAVYEAGALFMQIDDHGDAWSDLLHRRITYMNQSRRPRATLKKIFDDTIAGLSQRLPDCAGRDLMIAFLNRYYVTRLRKHQIVRAKVEMGTERSLWSAYE